MTVLNVFRSDAKWTAGSMQSHRVTPWAALVATCWSLAACASDTSSIECDPDQAWLDPSPWAEPDAPPSETHVAPGGSGWGGALNLDPAGNSGSAVFTYWITGDEEDFAFEFDLALGTGERDPEQARAALVFDGLLMPFEADGELHETLQFPFHPGDVVTRSMRVPGSEIDPGAHSVNLLYWTEHGTGLAGYSLSVLKDSSEFVQRPEEADCEIVEALYEDPGSVVRRQGSNLPLSGGVDLPDEDGTLPIRMEITPMGPSECDDLEHRLVMVAFLDHKQVPIGDFGLQPAVVVKMGEIALCDTVLRGLPTDGQFHSLQFWLLSGDGSLAEGEPGTRSPANSVPWPVDALRW